MSVAMYSRILVACVIMLTSITHLHAATPNLSIQKGPYATHSNLQNANFQTINFKTPAHLMDENDAGRHFKITSTIHDVQNRADHKSVQQASSVNHSKLPKSEWWAACVLAFLCVIKRRLFR